MRSDLKLEIKEKYPSLKTLSILERLAAHFIGSDSTFVITEHGEKFTQSQSAILRRYKGKEYFVRFGRL